MPDILHDFPIAAPAQRVFEGLTTPADLDAWWTKRSAGKAVPGAIYELWFGPDYDWRAEVTQCIPNRAIEWRFSVADPDWTGTVLRIGLTEKDNYTQLQFQHLGWAETNAHFRTSNYCWAMYLRILKRYLEFGEVVAYEERLTV